MAHRAPLRPFVYLLDIAALVVCCVGIVHIAAKPGLPVDLESSAGTVYCHRTDDPLLRRIREHEAVLKINGQPITTVDDVEFILDRFHVGQTVVLTLSGIGGERTEELILGHYYEGFYLATVITVSALFFGVGLIVFWRKPGDPAARVYHFGSLGTAMMLSTTWGSLISIPTILGPALRVIFSTMYAFVPLLFFHFMRLFPRARPIRRGMFLPALYGIAALLAIGNGASFIAAWSSASIPLFHTHLTWFTATRWFMIALVFNGLWTIRSSYARAGDEGERRKIRWVVWGLFIGFLPFVVLWVIPHMILSYGLVPESVMLLASGFIPLAFGASIIKYHIMDIDLILNRSVVYGTVMGMIAVIYTAIVGGAASLVSSLTYEETVGVSAGAAIIVALLFEPVRRIIQQEVDRRFFRVRYDYRKAERKFQEDIATCLYAEDVIHLFIDRIAAILSPERLLYVLYPANGQPRVLEERGFTDSTEAIGNMLRTEAERAPTLPFAIPDRVEPGVPTTPFVHPECEALGIALAHVSRASNGRILGLLLLGNKLSGSRFSSEDIDLLSSLLQQVGLEIERHLLQKEVLEKAEETVRLERLNAMKSDFVSYVSHELRTPLTSIKMFAEMMQQRLPRQEKHSLEYLRIIEGEADRLQRMVDTILDSARIDRGDVHYVRKTVQLETLLRDVLKTLRYQLSKEHFKVSVAYDRQNGHRKGGARRFTISADSDAVREALLNLLSNAMKYSLGETRIRVTLRRQGKTIRCSVEDHGRGISPEAKDHIFQKFYRDPDLPRRIQGVGIGLSVVKHIMDEHDGSIELSSTPGAGSTFTLVFPAISAPPGEVARTLLRTEHRRRGAAIANQKKRR